MGGERRAAGGGRRAAKAQVFVADLDRPVPDAADVHHLGDVLRLRRGDEVVAADGRGGWRWCSFRSSADPSQVLEPEGDAVVETRPAPSLTVAFTPVKGDRPEWIVQKLTELGIDRIVVLVAERSVVRWQGDRARKALGRLEEVARHAAAQSRQLWLPSVSGICALAQLAVEAADAGLCIAEPGGSPPSLGHPAVAIGPEGGWSDIELALDLPWVGLGSSVLRAETAAVTAGVLLGALRAGTVGPAMASISARGAHVHGAHA